MNFCGSFVFTGRKIQSGARPEVCFYKPTLILDELASFEFSMKFLNNLFLYFCLFSSMGFDNSAYTFRVFLTKTWIFQVIKKVFFRKIKKMEK